MTNRQQLQLRASKALLDSNKPDHPTLGGMPFNELTDAQLRELIDYYKAEALQ